MEWSYTGSLAPGVKAESEKIYEKIKKTGIQFIAAVRRSQRKFVIVMCNDD